MTTSEGHMSNVYSMVTVDLPREGHVKKYRVSSWVGLGLNVGLWAGWLLLGGV